MGREERHQEGQVIVPGIAEMSVALSTDGVRLRADQRVHRLKSLHWRGARLPIADDLPQQGDEGIGLLLMLAAVFGQGVIGLLMELLEATDEHLRQVIQGLSRLDTDRKSTRLNSSHLVISYAVFCLKKKKNNKIYRDDKA